MAVPQYTGPLKPCRVKENNFDNSLPPAILPTIQKITLTKQRLEKSCYYFASWKKAKRQALKKIILVTARAIF